MGYDIHEARENGFDEEEIEYLYGPQTPTRPQDEDYVLYPRGPLGSQTAVGIYNGAYVGTYPTDDDALLAIGTLMDLHGVYPNVWRNDDHGGWTLVLMNDDGTEYEEVEEPDVDDDFPIELEYNDNPGVNAPPIWDEDTYYEQR